MSDDIDLAGDGGGAATLERGFPAGGHGLLPLASFDAACDAVLEAVDSALGLQLVMVTRVLGDQQVVLAVHDVGYGIGKRHSFAFADTLCARLVDGRGEPVCADVGADPVYSEAPLREQLEINAYLGAPLLLPDGTLFGTLAAFHPRVLGRSIEDAAPLVRGLARLLASLLAQELEVAPPGGLPGRGGADFRGERDLRTGLLTRSAWEVILEHEERRCQRLESAAAVLVIGLIGPRPWEPGADEQLVATAAALESVLRRSDAIARIGADEFAVLAVGTQEAGAARVRERLQERLEADGVAAAFGVAVRTVEGLDVAFRRADVSMDEARREVHDARS